MLFVSVYHLSFLLMILSINLPAHDKREIGLYAAGFAGSLPGFLYGYYVSYFPVIWDVSFFKNFVEDI